MTHVRYMERIREYYLNQGYEKPYSCANFNHVPFAPLKKPLAESRVALFSTSDVSVRRAEGDALPATETSAPAALQKCRDEGADIAILTPV